MFHSFMENLVFSASISDLFLIKTLGYIVLTYLFTLAAHFNMTVILKIKNMCEKLIVRLKSSCRI